MHPSARPPGLRGHPIPPHAADESPFAVRQRIYAALPLPLGATSACEWLELVLTERFDPQDVRTRLQVGRGGLEAGVLAYGHRSLGCHPSLHLPLLFSWRLFTCSCRSCPSLHLQAQLPAGLQLLSVEEAEVKKIDGSNGEKMAQLLDSVEYYLVVERQQQDEQQAGQQEPGEEQQLSSSATSASGEGGMLRSLAAAVAGAIAAPAFVVERRTKNRGRVKVSQVDLKWALQEMEAVSTSGAAAGGVPLEVLPAAGGQDNKAVVRLRTACANGNPVLTPAMALDMLNGGPGSSSSSSSSSTEDDSSSNGAASGESGCGAWALAHIHRSDLRLRPMSVPQPYWLKLRSLLRRGCNSRSGGMHFAEQLECGRGTRVPHSSRPALAYRSFLTRSACPLPHPQNGGPPGGGKGRRHRSLVNRPGEPPGPGIMGRVRLVLPPM